MKKNVLNNKVVIFQAKSGAIELRGDLSKETIWATQAQIADAFDVNVRTVNEHLVNIFSTKELRKDSVIRKFRITAADGKKYDTQFYNLDAILSVGYRINSEKATLFRQWATKTLKAHIVDGYTINRARVAKNYDAFLEAVEKVKLLLPAGGTVDATSALELIKLFADTWISLDAYDKSTLPITGASKKQVKITVNDLINSLQELKNELLKKGEVGELFGQERQSGSVVGIIGNVFQTFGGHDLYPTVEEKSAYLLYFMVKNHPYSDGNKRHGAFVFVWFLKRTGLLRTDKMTQTALTALTLLIAESDPKHKDRMIGLVLMLLKK